jgi:hypothetical protein
MDFLRFDPTHKVLICTSCGYALPPNAVDTHLQSAHKGQLSLAERKDYLQIVRTMDFEAPELVKHKSIPPSSPPIPYLTLCFNGIACQLCDSQPYVCCNEKSMREHLKDIHHWTSGEKGGRPTKASQVAHAAFGTPFSKVTTSPVACQTFFRSNFFRFFIVTPVKDTTPQITLANLQGESNLPSLGDQIALQLAQKFNAAKPALLGHDRHYTQVSPWLDTTQWARYTHGHNLHQAARLIHLPDSYQQAGSTIAQTVDPTDYHLPIILDSLDRIIEQARLSLQEGQVNVFDQHRVNGFLSRRSAHRPLLYKMKDNTYKTYKKVWKQLLCFLYRLVWQRQPPALHCCLTAAQTVALSSAVERAAEVMQLQEDGETGESMADQIQALDQATLLLCIALLDHALHKDIYDSVIVGFFAVLGIRKDGCFSEAVNYTTHLSAFIKIAQLLVVQRSVLAVELDEVDHVADILDVMQDRFMVYGTRSPMNWAQKLRTYGKKIQDTTTSLGHIIWTDDGERLTYKDFEVTMTDLKSFVAKQVSLAQQQLHDLLLIHKEEDRESVAPKFNLRSLKDDPSIGEPGWNFLKHVENTALHGYEDWLLNRVIKTDWLRDEFLENEQGAKWKKKAVYRYLKQVDSFLERLLLIVHIAGGQPSRGTELTSLQFCNSNHGIRRSIFIENGLVSFVTFYHKGYSIQGSTKIIHRYLPREISELVIYYLWLVLPFAQRLQMLALDKSFYSISTPFLWGSEFKDDHISPWPSSRLSDVISREFQIHLNTSAKIQVWRHSVIAITRRHLKQGKFKKDYDLGQTPTWADKQSCHTTSVAGAIYARGIEEAPGHVASARAEYRQISREWHSWLGFALYLSSRASTSELLTAIDSSRAGSRLPAKRNALEELSSNQSQRQRIDLDKYN